MAVRREHVINRLRELGYRFKKRGDRVEIYKRKGSTDYASVRRRDLLDESEARSILRMAGIDAVEIDRFIDTSRASC